MDLSNQLQREVEIKLDLISFANYLKLVGFLGRFDSTVPQVNSFFDSEEQDLSAAGYGLRVRTEDLHGLVTLKTELSSSKQVAVRDELEATIPFAVASDVIELKRDILELDIAPILFVKEKFGSTSLARIVRFENNRQRKEFRLGDHTYTLEIDTTTFSNGSVDYELEIELPSEDHFESVENNLRHMFLSLDIAFKPQSHSKLTRAMKRAGVF